MTIMLMMLMTMLMVMMMMSVMLLLMMMMILILMMLVMMMMMMRPMRPVRSGDSPCGRPVLSMGLRTCLSGRTWGPPNADSRASTVHATHRTETPPHTTAPGGGSARQPGGWDEVPLRGEPRPAPQGHLPHLSQPHHLTRRTDEAGTAEMNPITTRLRTSPGPHHPARSHKGKASTLPDPRRGNPKGHLLYGGGPVNQGCTAARPKPLEGRARKHPAPPVPRVTRPEEKTLSAGPGEGQPPRGPPASKGGGDRTVLPLE